MKNKIIFGISVAILGVIMMILGILIFDNVPNVDTLTIKDGFVFFGSFMLTAVGVIGIAAGLVVIGTTLDV